MARKQAVIAQMEDEFRVPKQVQEAADEYIDKMRRKTAATSKFKTAKDNLVEAMGNAEVCKCRVITREGTKILELRHNDTLLLKPDKTQSELEAEDDDEE